MEKAELNVTIGGGGFDMLVADEVEVIDLC